MPKKRTPATSADLLPVPAEAIEWRIYLVRGQTVMLDSDLAELYQVETRVLNQAVRRNLDAYYLGRSLPMPIGRVSAKQVLSFVPEGR